MNNTVKVSMCLQSFWLWHSPVEPEVFSLCSLTYTQTYISKLKIIHLISSTQSPTADIAWRPFSHILFHAAQLQQLTQCQEQVPLTCLNVSCRSRNWSHSCASHSSSLGLCCNRLCNTSSPILCLEMTWHEIHTLSLHVTRCVNSRLLLYNTVTI